MKKSYGDRKKRRRQRNWHLQQLDREMEVDSGHEAYQRDYDEFLEDLEEDKVFRKNVHFYLSKNTTIPSSSPGPYILWWVLLTWFEKERN